MRGTLLLDDEGFITEKHCRVCHMTGLVYDWDTHLECSYGHLLEQEESYSKHITNDTCTQHPASVQ